MINRPQRTRSYKMAMATVAAVLATLTLAACGSDENGGGSKDGGGSYNMATQPWLGYGPWFIADEQGFFKDKGVDVKLTMFDNDADMSAALAGGRVDFANAASHSALQWLEQGLPIKIVLLLDASLQADAILVDSSVGSVADLAGKQVAYEEGGVSNLLLNYALATEDLSVDDVKSVPMGPSEAATALLSGRVPVAVTYEPYISEAKSSGADFEVLFTAAEQPGLISDVLVVSDKIIEEDPKGVQAVIDAWAPSVSYYDDKTEDAQAIIAEGVGSKPEELKTAFEGVEFYDGAENKEMFVGEYQEKTMPVVEEAAIEAKILKGPTEWKDSIVNTFVEAMPD